jgi:hypothetical protein
MPGEQALRRDVTDATVLGGFRGHADHGFGRRDSGLQMAEVGVLGLGFCVRVGTRLWQMAGCFEMAGH